MSHRWTLCCVLALAFGQTSPSAAAADSSANLDLQRKAFRQVYAKAELGRWDVVEARRDILESYILWPDLRAAWLRRNLHDDDAVRRFLASYGDIRPVRDIRYRYAKRLAKRNRHADYLSLYATHFATAGDSELDCLAAESRIALGYTGAARADAERLWLVGRNQNEACDPVFVWLKANGHLSHKLLRERFELAIDSRDFRLARYVARSLDEEYLGRANQWLRAQDASLRFLETADVSRRTAEYREQLAHAAIRVARSDPASAHRHWSRLRRDLGVDRALDLRVAQQIAFWAAHGNESGSERIIQEQPADAIDNEVRRWQARHALRDERWVDVSRYIDELTGVDADDEEWRYWNAVAKQETGERAEAMLMFSALAKSRSYYGFLAADQLDVDYALDSRSVDVDEAMLAELAARPGIARARELFMTGLDGRGRSEWNSATRDLDDYGKAQAAVLASRWDWHSRAISMAARAGRHDSLELRYPLPHRGLFEKASAAAGISESWAYGIARSESIFMRDVRSSAGAIGLMQLMPATGKSTAAELSLPYRGITTLVDPASNIRLGTWYLGKMHDRFDRHPVLATAAYNAGPHRVARWLPRGKPVDARVWVETIPFKETREYVRRVLTAGVIFEWRLSGEASRLSDKLSEVRPRVAAPSASGQ